MVHQWWCSHESCHTLRTPEQPQDGSQMEGTRLWHAVHVHACMTTHCNIKHRCMEHSLHLVAKHFVETIASGFSKQHGTSDINTKGIYVEDDEDISDDGFDNFNAADSLGKAIALVKQVRLSVKQSSCCTDMLTRPTDLHVFSGKSLFPCNVQPSQYHTAWAPFMDLYSMGITFQVPWPFHPTQTGMCNIYIFVQTDISITGKWSIHSPCRHKWEHAKSDKAAELHWLSFDPQRLRVPQGHSGCAHGKFSLTCCLPGSCCVEAIKRPADIFKWVRTHCLAHHPELQIPYQALGNDGHTFALSRAHKSTWQRHQESLQVVWPSWQYFLQHTLYVLIGFSLILWHQANVSLQVLDPNVKDMYFQHWWDTERYSASMKQLEDAVHCFLPFIIALILLTTLVSLTGIILCLCKVQKWQKRLLQVCFCCILHLCPALTSTR